MTKKSSIQKFNIKKIPYFLLFTQVTILKSKKSNKFSSESLIC